MVPATAASTNMPIPSMRQNRRFSADPNLISYCSPCRSARVIFPVAAPANCPALAHHSARQIAQHRRSTPGSRPRTSSRTIRNAPHRHRSNLDVPGRELPLRTPEQPHEPVARLYPADARTWMIAATAAVHLTRGHARNSDPRALGAPDRPVAVPNGCWRASEGLSGRDNLESQVEQHHRFGGRPPAFMQAAMLLYGV